MLNRHSLYFRYLIGLIACTWLVLILVYLFAANLFSTVLIRADQSEIDRNFETGEHLMAQWTEGAVTQDELTAMLNPVFSDGQDFLVLMDDHGSLLAYTEGALPYVARMDIPRAVESLKTAPGSIRHRYSEHGSTSLITIGAINGGYVLAGHSRTNFNRSLTAYQLRLILFLAVLLPTLILLSFLSTRQIAKPAINLSQAAEKLCLGEEVHIPEEYHGEINEIAHSFNVMSDRVSAAIQDLKREKEAVTLILEGLEEGIIAMDENGNLIHRNTAANAILAQAGPEVQADLAGKIVALCSGRTEGDPLPVTGTFLSGERVIQYIITALPRRMRRAAGGVALLRDITEQERLENTRREYVANISHELRTPLTSIRGISEGLQDGLVTDPTELHHYYTLITEESTRLSRLVNDLLELSGLQTRSEAFEMETIDPAELVMDLHDRNRKLFAEAGIDLDRSIPSEPLPDITSNEDRLSQVLTIFLDNARKFTPTGGRVEIGCGKAEDGVRFYVKDNGIGMSEETQSMAFDRFHQAEKSRTSKGSGLGLAIAKEIMDKMNVTIALDSKPGEGSIFSFVIPAAGHD